MKPRVSVLMSAYNTERYVARAIESILKQGFRDFEFLIYDDKSTDGTAAIVERYARKDKRIKFTRNTKNLGLTATLNVMLKEASGAYIARMDADDECLPTRFAAQVAFLDAHPKVGVVGSCGTIIDEGGRRIADLDYPLDDKSIRAIMVKRSPFAHPATMFRAAAVADVGPYDTSFRSAQDYEFFPRMLTRWKGANLPQRFLRYRWDFNQNEGFTSGKRQERNALRARWRMLARYGWPAWQIVHLIKPAISYCVPLWAKRVILKRLSRRAQ